MDCPYRDTKCYFAIDARIWDKDEFTDQPIELGTIECNLPENEECPWDIEPCEENYEQGEDNPLDFIGDRRLR